jgi:hypothetical protein
MPLCACAIGIAFNVSIVASIVAFGDSYCAVAVAFVVAVAINY